MVKKSKHVKPSFSVSGRERTEWDSAALAQLVLALARQRAAENQAAKKTTPVSGEAA
jgi:hypothetical protein